jgi:hypothetical protein
LAVIKNMIEPAIVGSILECDTVTGSGSLPTRNVWL